MGGALFPPKEDCPHLQDLFNPPQKSTINKDSEEEQSRPALSFQLIQKLFPHRIKLSSLSSPSSPLPPPALPSSCCSLCNSNKRVWCCLLCGQFFCLEDDHMDHHSETTGHLLSLDLDNAKFWCVGCHEYVIHPELRHFRRYLYSLPDIPTLSQVIHGIQEKKYQKIMILTGAGISVAAGIPDFRTPGTGLYSQLEKYHPPNPQAVFDLEYFKTNPKPFYEVARGTFLKSHPKPVLAHQFIKILHDRGQLFFNFTQNIDGLEIMAGLPLEYLIQAHGHMRTAHCIDCQTEYPMEEFNRHLEEQTLYLCPFCSKEAIPLVKETTYSGVTTKEGEAKEEQQKQQQEDSSSPEVIKGLIKPDIVFFGESLPENFAKNRELMKDCDLVIVMGTSLKVYPFASLLDLIPTEVPLIMINRENPGIDKDVFLFVEGEIENTVQKILKGLKVEESKREEKEKDNGEVKAMNRRQTSFTPPPSKSPIKKSPVKTPNKVKK